MNRFESIGMDLVNGVISCGAMAGGDVMVSTEMPKIARLRNGAYRDSDGDGS